MGGATPLDTSCKIDSASCGSTVFDYHRASMVGLAEKYQGRAIKLGLRESIESPQQRLQKDILAKQN